MFDLAGGRCTSSLSSVDLFRWNNKPKHIHIYSGFSIQNTVLDGVFSTSGGLNILLSFRLKPPGINAPWNISTTQTMPVVSHKYTDRGGISLSTRTYYVPR